MQLDRRQFVHASAAAVAMSAVPAAVRAEAPTSEWRQLPTEPFRGKQDDIAFVSRKVGWYGNGSGKLYRTTDGGDTWTRVWDQPGTFIRALGFIDEANGFLGNVGTDYYPNVTDTRPLSTAW